MIVVTKQKVTTMFLLNQQQVNDAYEDTLRNYDWSSHKSEHGDFCLLFWVVVVATLIPLISLIG